MKTRRTGSHWDRIPAEVIAKYRSRETSSRTAVANAQIQDVFEEWYIHTFDANNIFQAPQLAPRQTWVHSQAASLTSSLLNQGLQLQVPQTAAQSGGSGDLGASGGNPVNQYQKQPFLRLSRLDFYP